MKQYLITGIIEKNSKFRCVDYPKNRSGKTYSFTENEIIIMINMGDKFFTGEGVKVTAVNGNIKSIPNGTKEDNIGKLPIVK